jgi:adenosylcobyric acid synthase
LYYQREHVAGTHVHGVFDDDSFRTEYFKAINPGYIGYCYPQHRDKQIQGFANMVKKHVDITRILNALQ